MVRAWAPHDTSVHHFLCMIITSSRLGINRYGYQSCSWSAEQGKLNLPCPSSYLKIRSRETGSTVQSRVSQLILHRIIEDRLQGTNIALSSRKPTQKGAGVSPHSLPWQDGHHIFNREKNSRAFFGTTGCMYVCMVITYSRVWINRVRLPILLVVS